MKTVKKSKGRGPKQTSKAAKFKRARGKASRSRASGKSSRVARARRANPVRHEVEIDEERERAGGSEKAFDLGAEGAVDGVAEELGEGYVLSVTSGEQAAEDIRNEELPEDEGGPFVETSAWTEFARGTDASNPVDAEPADLPTVSPYRRN